MNSVRSRRNWQTCFCPTIDSCTQDLVRGCCRPSTLKRYGASLSTWTSTGFANTASPYRTQQKKFNGETILFSRSGKRCTRSLRWNPATIGSRSNAHLRSLALWWNAPASFLRHTWPGRSGWRLKHVMCFRLTKLSDCFLRPIR